MQDINSYRTRVIFVDNLTYQTALDYTMNDKYSNIAFFTYPTSEHTHADIYKNGYLYTKVCGVNEDKNEFKFNNSYVTLNHNTYTHNLEVIYSELDKKRVNVTYYVVPSTGEVYVDDNNLNVSNTYYWTNLQYCGPSDSDSTFEWNITNNSYMSITNNGDNADIKFYGLEGSIQYNTEMSKMPYISEDIYAYCNVSYHGKLYRAYSQIAFTENNDVDTIKYYTQISNRYNNNNSIMDLNISERGNIRVYKYANIHSRKKDYNLPCNFIYVSDNPSIANVDNNGTVMKISSGSTKIHIYSKSNEIVDFPENGLTITVMTSADTSNKIFSAVSMSRATKSATASPYMLQGELVDGYNVYDASIMADFNEYTKTCTTVNALTNDENATIYNIILPTDITGLNYAFSYLNSDNTVSPVSWAYTLNNCNIGSNIVNFSHMFANCHNLSYVNFDAINTDSIKYIDCMFFNCDGLAQNVDIRSWHMTAATDYSGLFSGCSNTYFNEVKLPAFYNSMKTTEFGTESMQSMFEGCTYLQTVDLYDTVKTQQPYAYDNIIYYANLKSTANLFANCVSLNHQNMNFGEFKSLQTTNGMFKNCKSLTDFNVAYFNTHKAVENDLLTDIGYMFAGCNNSKFKTFDLCDVFETTSVKNFEAMFMDCSYLTDIHLENMNILNAVSMKNMFAGCKNLTGAYVGDLNVSWTDDENLTNLKSITNMFALNNYQKNGVINYYLSYNTPLHIYHNCSNANTIALFENELCKELQADISVKNVQTEQYKNRAKSILRYTGTNEITNQTVNETTLDAITTDTIDTKITVDYSDLSNRVQLETIDSTISNADIFYIATATQINLSDDGLYYDNVLDVVTEDELNGGSIDINPNI